MYPEFVDPAIVVTTTNKNENKRCIANYREFHSTSRSRDLSNIVVVDIRHVDTATAGIDNHANRTIKQSVAANVIFIPTAGATS